MNDFDQLCRYIAKRLSSLGFFRWLMGDEFLNQWRFERWLETQTTPFPGNSDQRTDSNARCRQLKNH